MVEANSIVVKCVYIVILLSKTPHLKYQLYTTKVTTMAKKKNANHLVPQQRQLVAAATAESVTVIDHESTANATKGNQNNDDTTMNTATEATATTTTSTEVYELLQVDLGDMVKVKQVLDECVAMILLDYLPENTAWDNFKLSIMTCACIAAMIAQMQQYSNITIPSNRVVLIVCGTIYFVCSTLLQYITTFIDEDTIIYTQPITEKTEAQRIKNRKNHLSLMMQMMNSSSISSSSKKSGNDEDDEDHHNPSSMYLYYNRTTKTFTHPEPALPLQNPKLSQYGLRIRTTLPRFSQYYTVTFELQVPQSTSTQYQVTQTWSIGQFFDHAGYFDEIGFANAIEQLLIEQLDAEQYSSSSTADATKKLD